MLQIPVCISRIVSGQLTAASRCLSCHGCHQSCQSVPSPSYSYRLSLPTWALGLPFLLGIAFGASSRDAMRCSPQWSLTARGSFTLPVGAVEENLWLWRTLGGLLRSQLLPSCVFWRQLFYQFLTEHIFYALLSLLSPITSPCSLLLVFLSSLLFLLVLYTPKPSPAEQKLWSSWWQTLDSLELSTREISRTWSPLVALAAPAAAL